MKAVIVDPGLGGGSLVPALCGRELAGKLLGGERSAEHAAEGLTHAIRRIVP